MRWVRCVGHLEGVEEEKGVQGYLGRAEWKKVFGGTGNR